MPHTPPTAQSSARQVEQSLSISSSRTPGVHLYRPLKLFGKTFKVQISTGLTLSPDTVLHAALGLSLQQLARGYKPPPGETDKVQPLQAIKDFLRGATGRNKLSDTTKRNVTSLFGRFIPEDELSELLQGREPHTSPEWQSAWEMVLLGMGEPGDDEVYQLVRKFAALDRIVASARQTPESAIAALLELHIGRPHESWRKYNPNLSLAVALLVDTSLRTLAAMDGAGLSERLPGKSRASVSELLPLLAPGKKPMGHWLLTLQKAASCANLEEFSSLMLRKGIKRHSYAVGHSLLKKWSSCQQMMPLNAALSVLTTVGGATDRERELRQFALARFLSFLCDFVVAGSRGDPPSWELAQEQIRRRYIEIYDQCGASREAA